jgi:hypothetical protein
VLQEDPDLAVAIMPYGGRGELDFGSEDVARGKFRVQIRVRGDVENPQEPGERVYAIWAALHRSLATLNGTLYRSVMPLQAPIFLKTDARRRSVFVFNVEAYSDTV